MWTHRDPLKTVSSLTGVAAFMQSMFSDSVDVKAIQLGGVLAVSPSVDHLSGLKPGVVVEGGGDWVWANVVPVDLISGSALPQDMVNKGIDERMQLEAEGRELRIFDIHYEDLRKRPLEMVRRIYEFFGIDWTSRWGLARLLAAGTWFAPRRRHAAFRNFH